MTAQTDSARLRLGGGEGGDRKPLRTGSSRDEDAPSPRPETARGGHFRQLYEQRPGLGVLDRPGAEKLGHTAHIHEWEISAGGDIAAWMEERHHKADHILCVISKVYLTKDYSSWERQAAQWAAASKRPNFVLPVFVEECERRRCWRPSNAATFMG